jgi:hypothetical protein
MRLHKSSLATPSTKVQPLSTCIPELGRGALLNLEAAFKGPRKNTAQSTGLHELLEALDIIDTRYLLQWTRIRR